MSLVQLDQLELQGLLVLQGLLAQRAQLEPSVLQDPWVLQVSLARPVWVLQVLQDQLVPLELQAQLGLLESQVPQVQLG